MCRVLEVSRSGFYAWLQRKPSAQARSDAALKEQIVAIHESSRATYGAPRIHFELKELGRPLSQVRPPPGKSGGVEGFRNWSAGVIEAARRRAPGSRWAKL